MFSMFSESVIFNSSFRNSLFSFFKNKQPKTYVVNGKVIKVVFLHILFVMCKSKMVLSFCSWALDS